METQLKISEFVALTGTTQKTVLYYHKIGLLPEPRRSANGYRLYGAAELSRMQLIGHLKRLGLDLPRIKGVLGGGGDAKDSRETLLSLKRELVQEQQQLAERIAGIERLLAEESPLGQGENLDSVSFQMISGVLGPEKMEDYAKTCPDLFSQQQKVFGILDDFQWGEDYDASLKGLADFFRANPDSYEKALAFGVRLGKLGETTPEEKEIDDFAREAAAFIREFPALKDLVSRRPDLKGARAGAYRDMVETVKSRAQLRFGELLHQYLGEKQEEER